ncbi:MAG: cutinase family protein, partial [Thermoleophilia bacterium]|nr:cutinase family protein [Thermoleophilia bacterium]
MTVLPGIARLGISAALVGALGAGVTAATAHAQQAYDDRLAADNVGVKWHDQRPKGDGLDATLDGRVRLAMAGLAVGGLAAAAGAALLHQPTLAIGALGASLGLAGAALLGGTGSLKNSTGSMFNAVSAMIHSRMLPTERSVRAQLPRPSIAVVEPKPTEAALRRAPLAHMPGTPDHELAKRNAAATVAKIDWSKPDILIWVPGTGVHELDATWTTGAAKQFGDRASVVMVDYPASQDFRGSVSTGMETLRLVLAEIAKRGADGHRVLLGGQSQGSMVIAEAIADPTVHAAVDRVMLYGSMGLALSHYDDGRDAKVVELNDRHDPIRHSGAVREQFMNAVHAKETGIKLTDIPDLVVGIVGNINLVGYWQTMANDTARWDKSDPHQYTAQHKAGLEWLDTGTVQPG